MASVLQAYKCMECKLLPEDDFAYHCNALHWVCSQCFKKGKIKKCKQCSDKDFTKADNPILRRITSTEPKKCSFSDHGCKWSFSEKELPSHIEECKYRPFDCILNSSNMLQCQWTGRQHELPNHMSTTHPSILEFDYYQEARLECDTKTTRRNINLVNAFSRHFTFFLENDIVRKRIVIIIYLLGRRCDAQKYYYEFEIRSPKSDNFRKIKFIEQCYSDADDIEKFINEERCCISLSQSIIQTHLMEVNGKSYVYFRFIIKRKSGVDDKEDTGDDKSLDDNKSDRSNKGLKHSLSSTNSLILKNFDNFLQNPRKQSDDQGFYRRYHSSVEPPMERECPFLSPLIEKDLDYKPKSKLQPKATFFQRSESVRPYKGCQDAKNFRYLHPDDCFGKPGRRK